METIEKEKGQVYTIDQLDSKTPLELKEILNDRQITFHPNTGDTKLKQYIMDSNPLSSIPTGTALSSENDVEPIDNRSDKEKMEMFKAGSGLVEKVKPVGGIVLIELVDKKKTGSIRVRGYTDRLGNPRELKDHNNQNRVVTITKNLKLDMNVVNDKLLLEHLLEHPVYVLGSDPCLRIVDTEVDANKNIDRKELAIEAQILIKQQDEETLRDIARLINIAFTDKTTIAVLKAQLYEFADKTPEDLLSTWNHPDRDIRILVNRGMNKSLIIKNNGVYKYGEATIGTTFEECVLWFKSNEDLIPSFRAKI